MSEKPEDKQDTQPDKPTEPVQPDDTTQEEATQPVRTRRAPASPDTPETEETPPEAPPSPPPRRDPHRPLPPPSPMLQAPQPAPPRPPSESGLYFPWWSVVGLVAVVGLLSCGIWGLLYMGGGSAPPGGRTPTIFVLTATITPAEPTLPMTNPPATETPLPQPTATDTLPPSNITLDIGVTVEIVGTGSAGLSIREGAGTSYAVLDVAQDGEFFTVEEGPQFGNGYEWWYIVDSENPDRAGWSVRQYMQAIAPAPPTEQTE